MKLSPEQIETIKEWLDDKRKNPSCTSCGKNVWSVSDRTWELRPFFGGGLNVGGGPLIPVCIITCSNCGHMVFFNALLIGIEVSGKNYG